MACYLEGVPKVMPGSQTDKNGETIYEIVEVDSDAYIQQDSGVTAADGEEHAYEVTNMAAVSLEVEKVWHGTQASSVTVGLYRYVTDDGEGTAVPVTDDEKPVTAELNGANGWKYTLRNCQNMMGMARPILIWQKSCRWTERISQTEKSPTP